LEGDVLSDSSGFSSSMHDSSVTAVSHLGYQPLDTDPSKTTVNSINKKLKSLKDQDKLNKRTYDQSRPKDATIAKFYRLPKIHKDNNPLRSIVSLPGSPTYNLSKYLADILKSLVSTSPHSVKVYMK
jgi:hypothetical protein